MSIGNGAMGATVFGGVSTERLQFNEKTLWTGGPGVPDHEFGNWPEPRPGALAAIRQRIAAEGQVPPEDALAALRLRSDTPRHRRFGAYQSFGDVRLSFPDPGAVTGYRRELDIARGVARVTYRASGVGYTREYFASAPDGAVVVRLRADRPGSGSRWLRTALPPGAGQRHRVPRGLRGGLRGEGR